MESSEANLAFPEPDPGGLREYLAIPDRLAPAVTNWVLACTPAGLPAEFDGAIGIVTRYFQRQFTYRLGVDDGGRDPVTVFMEAREGHCTLFASAAALMLRAHGIPTRVVAGYLCSERHPYTGRWVVRERDGHAWCEAWDAPRRRWVLVGAFAGVWQALRTPAGVAVLLTAAAVVGAWIWRRGRARVPRDPAARLRDEMVRTMACLERRWVPSSLRRGGAETWSRWWVRVAPTVPPDRAAAYRATLEAYQDIRYRTPCDADAVRAWLAAAHRTIGRR